MPKILDKTYQEQLIHLYTDAFAQRCSPAAIIIFGSAARGAMTENSDIDIAVILPDMKSLITAKKAWYAAPPQGIDPWPCDILWYTEAEFLNRLHKGGVAEIISREGMIVYGRLP